MTREKAEGYLGGLKDARRVLDEMIATITIELDEINEWEKTMVVHSLEKRI